MKQAILTVLALVWIYARTTTTNRYIMNYHKWITSKFAHWLGTLMASLIEGICWWYIINHYII